MLIIPAIYIFFGCFNLILAGNLSIKNRIKRGVGGSWGYTSHNGPSTWGGTCLLGKKQSPINIQLGSAIVKNFPPFYFGEHYLTKHKFHAINNGHTIYVALEDDSIQPVISGGGLGSKFIFQQLHLHWESEHEFEGKRADLEMHLVHYNAKYGSFAKASTQPDGVAVLAVIFNKDNETNSLTENFFDFILDASNSREISSHPGAPINSILEKENQEEKSSQMFALRDLLPKYVSRFFRYEGSLTTPSCDEVVQWTVFINRLTVSDSALEAFRTLQDHEGNELDQNFRPIQKLNGREVYIQIQNYDKPATEYEQMHSGCSQNALFSIHIFYCCLFILHTITNYKIR